MLKFALGLALVLFGVVFYLVTGISMGWGQRIPLISILLMSAGLVWMIIETKANVSKLKIAGNIFGWLLFGGFLWWTLSFSEYEAVPSAGDSPTFMADISGMSLRDASSQPFDMQAQIGASKGTLLVFYRGYW